jgi:hypothetical protein
MLLVYQVKPDLAPFFAAINFVDLVQMFDLADNKNQP